MTNIFIKYKKKHKNEVAYVCGSGLSLNKFIDPPEKGVYITANHTFLHPNINDKVNYIFTEAVWDKDRDSKRKNDVVVFFDQKYSNTFGTNSYPYGDCLSELNIQKLYNNCSSTIFHCIMFALYIGCTKIYLVGCDGGKTHFVRKNNSINFNILLPGWVWFKNYIETNYPDVEIISINPEIMTYFKKINI